MKISLSEEMKRIDRESADVYGISEMVLMENAGHQSAQAMKLLLKEIHGKEITVLAGSGNNGGDALVAARHLLNYGAKLKVYFVGELEHRTSATEINYRILERMGVVIKQILEDADVEHLRIVLARFSDGIMDGMIGTGFRGMLRDSVRDIVHAVNASGKPVLAIDIPTGVEADTGRINSEAVCATMTLALGLPKPGHYLYPGVEHAGILQVDDIGIPSTLLEDSRLKLSLLDDSLAKKLYPARSRNVHKGTCGKVFAVAGSQGMAGAAVLSSSAVLRAGAGIATLAVPKSLLAFMGNQRPEVMVRGVCEEEEGCFNGIRALEQLRDLAKESDTVLIGPGIGRRNETCELVRKLSVALVQPVVLDADGIFAFRGHLKLLREFKQIPILTPHLGEMAGILDIPIPELKESVVAFSKEAAMEYRAIFVVKSDCTIAAFPDGSVYFTTKGNAGMATAGCGDVLAGTIAGLVKQVGMENAALLGVYLHGLAGDMAYSKFGNGLLSGDVLDMLPAAQEALRKMQATDQRK